MFTKNIAIIVIISLKKTFEKYLSTNFIFYQSYRCRHSTWLKKKILFGLFPQCGLCYWLDSGGFFEILWFIVLRVPYWQLLQLLNEKIYWNTLRYSILNCFMEIHIPKNISAEVKMKLNISHTFLQNVNKCFK